MGIGREQVEHVAMLARLALSEQELTTFQDQLSRILEHAGKVQALNTEGVEPTSHAIPLVNVFRRDEVIAPLSREETLSNAPAAEAGYFRVPRIIEEDG